MEQPSKEQNQTGKDEWSKKIKIQKKEERGGDKRKGCCPGSQCFPAEEKWTPRFAGSQNTWHKHLAHMRVKMRNFLPKRRPMVGGLFSPPKSDI